MSLLIFAVTSLFKDPFSGDSFATIGVAVLPEGEHVSTDSPNFEADRAILGYKYQIRYALLLLLEARQGPAGADVCIDIEKIDDIDVSTHGITTKVVQTKDTVTVLTDASAAFWKTVRIWSEAIKQKTVDIAHLESFELITTSAGAESEESIIRLLQQSDENKRANALTTMRALANDKQDQRVLGSAYKAFNDLLPEQQEKIVEKMLIVTNAPTFDELDKLISKHIVQGPPGKEVPFSKVLFGKWDFLIEEYLRDGKHTPIDWNQLQSLLWEITQEFQEDNLPTNFEGMLLDVFPAVNDDNRVFVRQLNMIGATEKQIQHSQRVYLKATQLLGFWQRNVIVRPDEIARNEENLSTEWDLQQTTLEADLDSQHLADKVRGMRLYQWSVQNAPLIENLRIRSGCRDCDVIRGCFQQLADRRKIGWHPNWNTLLNNSGVE